MPMMPSPAAGLTYAAIKVAGYAVFARVLNRYAEKPASPLKFALVKTAFGLVYRDGLQRGTMALATVAGTAWSYVLDALMLLLFGILPGMEMPFC